MPASPNVRYNNQLSFDTKHFPPTKFAIILFFDNSEPPPPPPLRRWGQEILWGSYFGGHSLPFHSLSGPEVLTALSPTGGPSNWDKR